MADLPFLDIDEFAAEYRGALSDGERITVDRLLQVISDGIRARKPDVDPDRASRWCSRWCATRSPTGIWVRCHRSPTCPHRQEAGTFDSSRVVDDYLSARQKRLLGIAVAFNAAPRAVHPGDY